MSSARRRFSRALFWRAARDGICDTPKKINNSDGNMIVNLSEQKNHRVVISFTRFLFYTVFVISSSPLLLIEDDGENKVANLHI